MYQVKQLEKQYEENINRYRNDYEARIEREKKFASEVKVRWESEQLSKRNLEQQLHSLTSKLESVNTLFEQETVHLKNEREAVIEELNRKLNQSNQHHNVLVERLKAMEDKLETARRDKFTVDEQLQECKLQVGNVQ